MKSKKIQMSRAQAGFFNGRKPGNIYIGGVGTGKTLHSARKAVFGALKSRRSAIVTFSYRNLKDNVLPNIIRTIDEFNLDEHYNIDINKSDMVATINETQVLLRGGWDPNQLRGLSLHDAYIDEAREFKDRTVFEVMIARLREAKNCTWNITTTTRGYDWVFQLIDNEGLVGKLKDDNYVETENLRVCKLSTRAAAKKGFIPPSYYKALLDDYAGAFALQELEADFVEFSADVIDPEWFNIIAPARPVGHAVRAWDLATSSKKHADYSAGALCFLRSDGSYSKRNNQKLVIADMKRVKLDYPKLRSLIIETAIHDGPNVDIILEKSGQQNTVITDLKTEPALHRYTIRATPARSDKLDRAQPWISRAESTLVDVCEGSWNKDFFAECAQFSANYKHKQDDQIDAVSLAWQSLKKTGQALFVKLY